MHISAYTKQSEWWLIIAWSEAGILDWWTKILASSEKTRRIRKSSIFLQKKTGFKEGKVMLNCQKQRLRLSNNIDMIQPTRKIEWALRVSGAFYCFYTASFLAPRPYPCLPCSTLEAIYTEFCADTAFRCAPSFTTFTPRLFSWKGAVGHSGLSSPHCGGAWYNALGHGE